jgi:hypothetical protein
MSQDGWYVILSEAREAMLGMVPFTPFRVTSFCFPRS